MKLSDEIADLQRRLSHTRDGVITIATAESATAGRIADRLTGAPGASDYFLGGIVAYSNAAKESLLDVRRSTLARCGAVSPEVACEMAEGARRAYGATVSVSDTGIAGPGGATAGKPVGLFFLALATPEGCSSHMARFDGDRDSNKDAAAEAVLTLLRDYLLQCCDVRGVNAHGSI